MTMFEILSREMDQEAITTRKMLARIPSDKYGWKPHEKSMSIEKLANHIAELPAWVGLTLNTSELDFASNPYTPTTFSNSKELLTFFEQNLDEARQELAKGTAEQLEENWILREGDQIFSSSSKLDVLRMTFCQIVHHRAQLGVYLRLLDVPIPGSYGPSADDPNI